MILYHKRFKKMTLFEKCTNVGYLRTKIKPLPRKVCDHKKIKWISKNNFRQKKGFWFPYKFFLDLKFVSNLYGASFELRKNGNPGYSSKKKLIYLTADEGEEIITNWDISKFFTHELAHRIQHMEWEHDDNFTINIFRKALLYERTAERLAYFINKEYFLHLWDLSHQCFTGYRTKEGIEYLKKYLKGNLKGKRWRE